LKYFRLQLVLVMVKDAKLMQCQQPLVVFSPPGTDSSTWKNGLCARFLYIFIYVADQGPITTRFNEKNELKNTYHLHELRLAFTLWTRKSVKDVFRSAVNTQFISQIVTAVSQCKSQLDDRDQSFSSLSRRKQTRSVRLCSTC
jgi:hypothetical protein